MTVRVSLDATAVPARPVGAGRYVLELASALSKRDDVDLVVLHKAPPLRPLRLAWEQVRLPRVLRDLSVDVHHAPHYTMPERSRVPTVVTVHDMTFFDHPEWHERTKTPFFRRAIRVAADKADALVCVSSVTADRLHARLRPNVPVHVIPHGVDHARFHPGGEDTAPFPQPYVAFLGTLEPRKDVPTLVAAFDRIAGGNRDLTLVIAGLDGWGTKEVSEAIAHAERRDRIRRVGYLADDAVPALLRHAAAVAYPSLDEGFGLPALEALACGAPLVTTRDTAMAEVTGDAAVLIPPGDVDALAQAIEDLVAAGSDVDRLRRRGPEVASAYTWEKSAAAHVEVYRSVG